MRSLLWLGLVAGALGARPVIAQCPDGTPPPCRTATRAAPPVAPNSIAVLYFDNISRDTADSYLADGFSEEVMTRLGQVERLQVKSRAAVQQERRRAGDPIALGRSLGVAHLVTGSVMRAGNRVRVTVDLTRVATGNSVWGKSFDRATTDLIGIEAEIAESVAVNVGARLAPGERQRIEARPTRNAAAYDAYLRGRFEISRRTSSGFLNGIRYMQSAIQADSNMAPAWLGLSGIYTNLAGIYFSPELGLSRDSLILLARETADRAIRIDSNSVEALIARTTMEDPSRSVPLWRRVIDLRPRDAGARHNLALALRILGQNSEAVVEFRRALELEPDRTITLLNLAQSYEMGRHYALAKPWLDSAMALRPEAPFYFMEEAILALLMGDTATARTAADGIASHGSPRGREEILAIIEARGGDTAAAQRRVLRVDSALAGRDCFVSHDCLELASALASTGLKSRAMDVLERIQPHDRWLAYWSTSPLLDPLRDDPRYQRLRRESIAVRDAQRP